MVPAQNLSNRQNIHGGYGGCYNPPPCLGLMRRLKGYDYSASEACLGSDLLVCSMAEDESRTNSLNEAGSSSKDNILHDEREEGSWLQLGIGGHTNTTTSSHDHKVDPNIPQGGLIELDLLSGAASQHGRRSPVPGFRAPRPYTNIGSGTSFSTSLLLQHPGSSSSAFPHQELNWAFRSIPRSITAASSSSSSSSTSSSFMAAGPYFARPFNLHAGMDVPGPSSDVRIIDAPRRPHSGVWFMLQASQNQAKEPFLPQISKSYLRIKDGKMTVRLLMKYLVNKLELDSESEIEVTCRGQQLLPFFTLQHVRDNVWRPREAVTLLPDSSTTDHVMVLHYGRSA